MPLPPYQQTFTVEAADLDHMGHVNNITYLRWVQDIAIAHWEAAAPPEALENLLWVVRRHEIDYKIPAQLGDAVLVRTRVGHVHGLTFERHTEILRAEDLQVYAVARTLWVPIDRETRRPQRLNPGLRALFSVEQDSKAAPPSP